MYVCVCVLDIPGSKESMLMCIDLSIPILISYIFLKYCRLELQSITLKWTK